MSDTTPAGLGWSAYFLSQLTLDELALTPARVAAVHRGRLELLTGAGAVSVEPGATGEFAVGDWVLLDGRCIVRRLDRRSELSRRAAGTGAERQLIAANVDTLFVVTSCNAEFNPSRLERYLALAAEAGCDPVVLLTKADLCDEPDDYRRRAEALARGLIALPLDARDPSVADRLAPWTRPGQTAALVGSSGVGKTTLANALTGRRDATRAARADDERGRHTTTYRALLPLAQGGWLIDTPGMRELRLADAAEGIAEVFADIEDLAAQCRFRDCAHEVEPGCAVRAALDAGRLDPRRLANWHKLRREERRNSETLAEARDRDRRFGKMVRQAMDRKARPEGG